MKVSGPAPSRGPSGLRGGEPRVGERGTGSAGGQAGRHASERRTWARSRGAPPRPPGGRRSARDHRNPDRSRGCPGTRARTAGHTSGSPARATGTDPAPELASARAHDRGSHPSTARGPSARARSPRSSRRSPATARGGNPEIPCARDPAGARRRRSAAQLASEGGSGSAGQEREGETQRPRNIAALQDGRAPGAHGGTQGRGATLAGHAGGRRRPRGQRGGRCARPSDGTPRALEPGWWRPGAVPVGMRATVPIHLRSRLSQCARASARPGQACVPESSRVSPLAGTPFPRSLEKESTERRQRGVGDGIRAQSRFPPAPCTTPRAMAAADPPQLPLTLASNAKRLGCGEGRSGRPPEVKGLHSGSCTSRLVAVLTNHAPGGRSRDKGPVPDATGRLYLQQVHSVPLRLPYPPELIGCKVCTSRVLETVFWGLLGLRACELSPALRRSPLRGS